MAIRYNVTGDRRKELVKVISGITGAKAVYKFMPTCNYEIDYFTVTKDGTLLFDNRADSEEVEQVLEGIAAAGFACEAPAEAAEPEKTAQEESVGLTIEVPLDKVQVGNLTKLLDAKGSLIKKALEPERFWSRTFRSVLYAFPMKPSRSRKQRNAYFSLSTGFSLAVMRLVSLDIRQSAAMKWV